MGLNASYGAKLRMDSSLRKTIVHGQISVWEFGDKEGNRTERKLSHMRRSSSVTATYKEKRNLSSSFGCSEWGVLNWTHVPADAAPSPLYAYVQTDSLFCADTYSELAESRVHTRTCGQKEATTIECFFLR